MSAISQIGDLYCQNSSDLNGYQNTLAGAQLATSRGLLVCTTDDRLRREVIQQLICNFSLVFERIEQAFNIDFRGYFDEIWPQLAGHGQGRPDRARRPTGIRVLPAGRLLVRSGVHGVRCVPGTPEPATVFAGDFDQPVNSNTFAT